MAAQIITIAIEKGGAGKTVTASNLAYLMGDEGKSQTRIWLSQQANLDNEGNYSMAEIQICFRSKKPDGDVMFKSMASVI